MKKMIISDYGGNHWTRPKVKKYSTLNLDPKSKILHYGQGAFEGLMAYPSGKDYWCLFRSGDHYARFAYSCLKLAIPVIPKDNFDLSIKSILLHNKPKERPLYIRPFVFATGEDLSPFESKTFKFLVIAEEVDPHFNKESIKIVTSISQRISSASGTSDIKTGVNYASCMLAEMGAKDRGADMVLWLDENKRISELSGMNIFFVSKGVLYTPESGSILDGITRDSVIKIAQNMGIMAIRGYFEIKELKQAEEVFATGTRCGIVPITEIDEDCFNIGQTTRRINQELISIKRGDWNVYDWTEKIRCRCKD